jgi:hypothetical protein
MVSKSSFISAIALSGLIAGSSSAATLLYQYNFDNTIPGQTDYTPNVGTNGVLRGNISGAIAPTNTGVGPSGLPTDIALTNIGVNNTPTGSSLTGSSGVPNGGNFTPPANNTISAGTLSQFTVTMWVRRNSAATTGTLFPRLFIAGNEFQDTGSTTDGFTIALNNSNVEVRVRNNGGVPTPTGGQTFTNDEYQFLAVSFDLTSPNIFFSGAQQAASGGYSANSTIIYRGSQTAPVAGFASIGISSGVDTNVNGNLFDDPIAPITLNNAFVYLLNRRDLVRGLNGNGDDFRIYDGLLTIGELEGIRAAAVPEPTSLALAGLAGLTLMGRRRRA